MDLGRLRPRRGLQNKNIFLKPRVYGCTKNGAFEDLPLNQAARRVWTTHAVASGTLVFHFSTIGNHHLACRSSRSRPNSLDCLDHFHAGFDPSKDHVSLVEPRRFDCRQKELR